MSFGDIALFGIAVTAVALFARYRVIRRRFRHLPCRGCYVCRRLAAIPRPSTVEDELLDHFYRWETEPAVTPEQQR